MILSLFATYLLWLTLTLQKTISTRKDASDLNKLTEHPVGSFRGSAANLTADLPQGGFLSLQNNIITAKMMGLDAGLVQIFSWTVMFASMSVHFNEDLHREMLFFFLSTRKIHTDLIRRRHMELLTAFPVVMVVSLMESYLLLNGGSTHMNWLQAEAAWIKRKHFSRGAQKSLLWNNLLLNILRCTPFKTCEAGYTVLNLLFVIPTES